MRLQSTGTGGTNHGLRGQNTQQGTSSGLVGVDTSFNVDFSRWFGKIYVANGVQTFTGIHKVFISKNRNT